MAKTLISDSGCFKGILRRLLCQGSLQTHPSDQMPEPKKPEFNEPKPEAKLEATGAPGIVARLMGLDSLPETKWVPKGKAPESVTRSRSVNFMEYLLEFDAVQGEAHRHRRVRTSVSFREVPTLLNQQNKDLFALYLDEEDEKEMGLKVRKGKASVDLGAMKQKQKEEKSKSKKEKMRERLGTSKKVSKFIDEPRRVSIKRSAKSNNSKGVKELGVVLPGKKYGNKDSGDAVKKKSLVKPMHRREETAKVKMSKKSKNQLVIEEENPAECCSENSSPVSVLDVNEFSISDDTPLSDEPRFMDLNSRRKSSLVTANCDYPSSSSASTLSYDDHEQLRKIKNKDHESMDNQNIEYDSQLVAKFPEQSIMQSNWMPKKLLNFEDMEEMCMEFGQHVFEILLQQLIDELVGFNMEVSVL